MALAVEPFLWSIDSIVCSIFPDVGFLFREKKRV